jgi:hypothetical protein
MFLMALHGSSAGAATPGESVIAGRDDDAQRITLAGHVRPMVRPDLDSGPVSSSLAMSALQLIFKRSPTQETAISRLHPPG